MNDNKSLQPYKNTKLQMLSVVGLSLFIAGAVIYLYPGLPDLVGSESEEVLGSKTQITQTIDYGGELGSRSATFRVPTLDKASPSVLDVLEISAVDAVVDYSNKDPVVIGINGYMSYEAEKNWEFLVNDQRVSQAPNKVFVNDGDVITWILR